MRDYQRRIDPLTRSARKNLERMTAMYGELEGKLGRRPSEAEVKDALGWTLEKLRGISALRACQADANAHTPAGYGNHTEIEEVPDSRDLPVDEAMKGEIAGILREKIAGLPERDRRILKLYYFGGERMSMREIGEKLGLHESRISQLHAKALESLRKAFGSYGITRSDGHGEPGQKPSPDHRETHAHESLHEIIASYNEKLRPRRAPLGGSADGEKEWHSIPAYKPADVLLGVYGLPRTERRILGMYYVDNMPASRIGDALDMSKKRVSDIRKTALSKLAAALGGGPNGKSAACTDGILRTLEGVSNLPEKEKNALNLYFVRGVTFQRAGRAMKISRNTASRICNDALSRLEGAVA